MSSTLQLFSCLLNSLGLTASQLRLNVSQTVLLGNKMDREESVVSRILILDSVCRPKLASRRPEVDHHVLRFLSYSAYPL
jgi:hypothetical protein